MPRHDGVRYCGGSEGMMINHRRERLGFSTGDLAKMTGMAPSDIERLYTKFDIDEKTWNRLVTPMLMYQNAIPYLTDHELFTKSPRALLGSNRKPGT